MHDESAPVSMAAIEALCKIGDRQTLPVILAALHSPLAFMREKAVCGLLSFGENDASLLNAVIASLGDADHFVREAAAVALGESKTMVAIPALIRTLADEDTFVQDAAVQALSKIGSLALRSLIETLLSNENSQTRMWVAYLLGGIPDKRALDALFTACHETDPYVRSMAVASLTALNPIESIPELIVALTDSHIAVRLHAVQLLEKIGDRRAIEPLYVVAQKDTSHEIRETASKAAKQLDKFGK
jgi:HEAT repeat protein